MTVNQFDISRALEALREEYRKQDHGPMHGSGIGVNPAQAVTHFMAAPEVAERLARLLTAAQAQD